MGKKRIISHCYLIETLYIFFNIRFLTVMILSQSVKASMK